MTSRRTPGPRALRRAELDGPVRAARTMGCAAPLGGRRGLGVLLVVAIPFALQASGALRAGGFMHDGPRVGPGEDAPRDGDRACRRRRSSSSSTRTTLVAGDPAFETAAADRGRGRPESAVRQERPVAPAVRRGRSRRTATRRTTSSSSTYPPTIRRRPCRDPGGAPRRRAGLEVGLAGGPAFYGDVQAVSEVGPPSERGRSRCRWRRWPCCSCSARSSRRRVPLASAARRSSSRSRRSSSSRASSR